MCMVSGFFLTTDHGWYIESGTSVLVSSTYAVVSWGLGAMAQVAEF